MSKHELTDAERARGASNGGNARAEGYRKRREDAELRAIEKMANALVPAVDAFIEGLAAEAIALTQEGVLPLGPDHPTRIRAAAQIYDRVLGRATQRTEVSGSIDHNVEYRSRLADLLADHAARAKANGPSREAKR